MLFRSGQVKEKHLLICGTPESVEEEEAWVVHTDQGRFGFEGLAMSRYLDTELVVLVRDSEIIRVKEKASDDVVYKNVWISGATQEKLTGYVGSITRDFSVKKKIKSPKEMEGQVADLYLSQGEIKKITLKKERIGGKVLSVKDDSIELEGYGEVPVEEGFCVYKLYGDFERQSVANILVGYDCQEFVAADGKLCAALIVRPFEADTIRVLVMDTNFQSLFHDSIELEFLSGGTYTVDKKEYSFNSGDTMTLTPEDELLKKGRIIFQPDDTERGIRVLSVERACGKPAYPGRLEIDREENSLVLVNELYLDRKSTRLNSSH